MLPPIESPDRGSSLPIIANASALPCERAAGPKSATLGARPPTPTTAVSASGDGVFTNDDLGWLASTCGSASARPPYQEPAAPNAPSGSVRPAPASSETL